MIWHLYQFIKGIVLLVLLLLLLIVIAVLIKKIKKLEVKNAVCKSPNPTTKKGKENAEEVQDINVENQYTVNEDYYQGYEDEKVKIENLYSGPRADYYVE